MLTDNQLKAKTLVRDALEYCTNNKLAAQLEVARADILAVNPKGEVFELELKINFADYLLDWKKPKHHVYAEPHKAHKSWKPIPNYFIYVVPDIGLAERIAQHLKDAPYSMSCYGVRVCGKSSITGNFSTKLVRRPSKLHSEYVAEEALQQIGRTTAWRQYFNVVEFVREELTRKNPI